MEPASFAASILALAGLFDNAVDCFEYVQLGRNFERDYQTCCFKLNNAQLRLSRWGESIGIAKDKQDQGPLKIAASEKEVQDATEQLEWLNKLFEQAQKDANDSNFRAEQKGKELVVYDADKNRDTGPGKLNRMMRHMSLSRRGVDKLVQKVKWALHDEKQFRRLVEDIKDLVDGLLESFPAPSSVQQQLVNAEVKEFGDNEALPLLKEVAQEQDKLLAAQLEKFMAMSTTNYNISFTNKDNSTMSGMQIGHAAGPVYGSRPGQASS